MDDRRNPFLVLGLPYGADRESALAAFAARSKRARREPGFPYSVDDLTWALNQLEGEVVNPATELDVFRIPANPSTLTPPGGPGVLRLRPEPIERRTAPATTEEINILRDAAIEELIVDSVCSVVPATMERYGLTTACVEVMVSSNPKAVRPRRTWFRLLATACLAALGVGGGLLAASRTPSGKPSSIDNGPPPIQEETGPTDLGPILVYPPDSTRMSAWENFLDIDQLRDGTCFTLEKTEVSTTARARPVPCTTPHRFQVTSIFSVSLDTVAYTDISTEADAVCAWNQAAFVGAAPSDSIFGTSYFMPAESRWPLDRIITCYTLLTDEKLWTGTAKSAVL